VKVSTVALFDSLDMPGEEYGAVRDMTVSPVKKADVDEFCRRWHYSKTKGHVLWAYGLWQGATLVGVASYNLATMPASSAVFGPERWDWVVHMGRLVCAEEAPRNTESRLIAGSLKLLKRDRPVTRAVLTYAAASQGHIGTVYQATNAMYCGVTASTHYYLDEEGQRRAPKQGLNLSKPKALARGWTVHEDPPKHRYIYLLGTRTERREARALLRYDVAPYPKGVSA
jgi:hypothetical protein